jgi:hypothetical protein
MTEETTMADGEQIPSDNPWHHMKGMRGKMRIPGTILPKRLLRPYFYEHPYRINDKQYVTASISSLKDGLHFVYGSLYLLAGGVALEWSATLFRGKFEPWAILICLVIALPLHRYGKTLKRDRFEIFDRERGVYRWEYGWFKLKYREIPFWECEGYLVSAPNHMGLMRHMLFLQRPKAKSGIMIIEGVDYDLPLGYWSFLLQYMDKDKPLPDIPSLKKYPDRDSGLGDLKTWRKKIARREIIDPYVVWQAELSKHPEWDVGNYGRDLSKSGSIQIHIIFIALSVMFTIIFAIIYLFDLVP